MILLPGEEKILSSNEEMIVLTSQRIHMSEKQWGQSYSITIFLEDISSIETKYKSHVIFIILAALAVLAGVYSAGRSGLNGMILGLVVGGAFLLFWWFSRKNVISISSDGGSAMNFMVEGMRDEKVEGFIEGVCKAKLNRVAQLSQSLM